MHVLGEENDSSDSEGSLLNAIDTVSNTPKNTSSALMEINKCDVRFQLDSGADVNTIQKKFVRKEQVRKCSKTLFNKSSLTPLGETTLSL